MRHVTTGLVAFLTVSFVLSGPSGAATLAPDPLSAPGTLVVAGAPALPKVSAAAWLVADLDDGSVLAAKNAHGAFAPASALKTLSAITLVPHLDPAANYTATAADANIDGSKVGLVAGSVYTVDDLVHGMLLGSGNDAANAIATLSGGQAAAAAKMNAEALLLGATDTHAVNDDGLDAPGQVSSVHDLALFGRAVLGDPYLAKVVATTIYSFPAAGTSLGKDRKRFQIQNHNRLLRNVEGATGVKNGYTVAAKGSFVGSATRGGHSYVATVINSPGSTWHESRDLLEWAFATSAATPPTPVGDLDTQLEAAAAAAKSLAAQQAASKVADAAAGSISGLAAASPGLSDDSARPPLAAYIGGGAGLLLSALVLAYIARRTSLNARGRRAR